MQQHIFLYMNPLGIRWSIKHLCSKKTGNSDFLDIYQRISETCDVAEFQRQL